MILRHLDHPGVQATRYQTHGGGMAHMLLDSRHLTSMMFLAHVVVPGGLRLQGHNGHMEEIYIVQSGKGLIAVDEGYREVGSGDVVHIPAGAFQELINTGQGNLGSLVVRGRSWSRSQTRQAQPHTKLFGARPWPAICAARSAAPALARRRPGT